MTGENARPAASKSRPTARAVLVRAAPVLALAGVAGGLYGGVAGDVSLANLQQHELALRAYVADHPATFVAGYVLLYVLATASFVPLGLVLMLAGGFLLGPWTGAAAATAGATGGALLTYLAARFTVGGVIGRPAGEGRFAKLVQGFGANAFSYILTLRLIPFSPFGLVNVAAGVAHAPLPAYVAATVLGSIPICLIYAHLGAGLGEVFAAGRKPDLWIMAEPKVFVPLICLAILSLVTAIVGRRLRA